MPNSLRIVQQFFPAVTTVTQARDNIQIEVLPRDVAHGRAKGHHVCAMARACKRTFDLDGAIVSLGSAYLIKGVRATRYIVPQSVSREIVSFDRGSGFAPGFYSLYKPVQKMPPGSGTGHGPSTRRKTGKKNRPRHVTAGVRSVLSA
jgi:hypothetical protein